MTVAYLIVAHSANEQLRTLCDVLLTDRNARVYIHLDRKTADTGWLSRYENPCLVWISRHKVEWGSYSIARAILALLEIAIEQGDTERFVPLSGTCFPLLPPVELGKAILSLPEPKFAIWGKLGGERRIDRYGEKAATGYFPYSVRWLNPRRGIPQRLLWAIYTRLMLALPFGRRLPKRGLWKGSMFFVADRRLAKLICDEATELGRYLRYAHAPDEIFSQTVYGRDREARGLPVSITSRMDELQGAHFIRQRGEKRTLLQRLTASSPDSRSLLEADIPDALASGALFARKCSPHVVGQLRMTIGQDAS